MELEGHPKIGASWEGFVIKELPARARSGIRAGAFSRMLTDLNPL